MKSRARTFIVYIKFYERFYIHFNWIWCRISNRIFIRRIQRSGVEDEIKLRRLGYAVQSRDVFPFDVVVFLVSKEFEL